VGHNGEIVWDSSKPDGTPRKLMNVDKMKKQVGRLLLIWKMGLKVLIIGFLENENKYKQVKL